MGQDMVRKRKCDMVIRAKERAAKFSVPFDIHVDTIEWPERCPVLGVLLDYGPKPRRGPFPNSPSIDRRVPELGYVPGNVLVISMLANSVKHTAEAWVIQAVADWLHALENPEETWHETVSRPT